MRALKLQTRVNQQGRITLPKLPFRKGAQVELIILEQEPVEDDMLRASESSLSFWNNPVDDRIWNDA